jgi:hypothetical protein
LHAQATGQKRWCQRKSLLTQKFKMFYLLNDNSDLKSVFINKSISARSSKLALMLICFDKLFFRTKSYQHLYMWIINPSIHELSMINISSYQPLNINFLATFFAHKLSILFSQLFHFRIFLLQKVLHTCTTRQKGSHVEFLKI